MDVLTMRRYGKVRRDRRRASWASKVTTSIRKRRMPIAISVVLRKCNKPKRETMTVTIMPIAY